MFAPHTTYHSWVAMLVAMMSLLAIALMPDVASADEPPLRLSFINSAAKGGEKAHNTINRFLDASDDIDVTDSQKVWDEAKELGLEEKDFRSSSLREKNAPQFRQIMQNLDIEALMVLDVFGRGRTAQIVVIGPSGNEIADVREDVRRGRVSKAQAKDMLKRSFQELVPNVRDFREAGGWDAVEEEKEEEVAEDLNLLGDAGGGGGGEAAAEEAAGEDVSIKDAAVAKRRDRSDLDEGFRINVGALIGKRTLRMDAGDGFQLGHESPFVGFGGRVDGILLNFGDSALGFGVFGGYAPFTTIFDGSVEYASAYGRLGAEVRYLRPFTDALRFEIFGGAEATSVTIEQNEFYTGNRYVSARAGAGIVYKAGPVNVQAGGGVLPVFSVNNSDAAYGNTSFNLGYEATAGLSFGITDDIAASLNYMLHYYAPEYVEPKLAIAGPITSSDVMHIGVIAIGYSL